MKSLTPKKTQDYPKRKEIKKGDKISFILNIDNEITVLQKIK